MTGELVGLKKEIPCRSFAAKLSADCRPVWDYERDEECGSRTGKNESDQTCFCRFHVNGQQVPNVLFLDLNVDILEALTYPDHEQGYHLNGGYPSLKKETGITDTGECVSHFGREVSYIGETNTENTNRKFRDREFLFVSIEKEVRGRD